jgi:tRNA(Ile)-lysidine synthase
MAFLQHIKQFIARHNLLPPEASVLVACSGGSDSVALALSLRLLGYRIALAHINYGLRGDESDGDETFVQRLAADWAVPFFVKKADPIQLKESTDSLQAAARTLRYDFFEATMKAEGYTYCATGHQADDQAETSLLSLLRGAGPAIMHGIPVKRGPYVRPLLATSREEILEWLASQAQPFCSDKSNESDVYLRNRIRHGVLPAMRSVHPAAAKRIRDQQERYDQERSFVEDLLKPYREAAADSTLNWNSFVESYGEDHLPVLLRSVLADWGITGPAADEVMDLRHHHPGKGIDTGVGRVVRTREGISLRVNIQQLQQEISIGDPASFGTYNFGKRKVEIGFCKREEVVFGKKNIHFLDADKLVFPLSIRQWQQGDRMQPLGMTGSKLLSDIFIDERFSKEEKTQAIIVEDALGIVCLSGFRIANRVKVQPESKQLIKLIFQKQ